MVRQNITSAGDHLRESARLIGPRYIEGVRVADWQGPAASEAAEQNFAEAMTKAIQDQSRRVGIQRVDNAQWRSAAIDKGGRVIGERVTAAVGKYVERFRPILEAMNSAAEGAPRRTLDFRTNIEQRLVPVVEAAKRASGKG